MIGYERHPHQGAPGTAVDPVVLIGSLGSTATMWGRQIPALQQRADVLVLEHRGHGRSTGLPAPTRLQDLVDDLVEVLDAEQVPRAHVAGVSLGGMLALQAAISAPTRIGRVAVMCTSAAFDARQYWLDRAALVLADGPGAVAADIVSRWFTADFAAGNPALVSEMIEMIAGTEPAGYAGCCRAIAEMDLRPQLSRVGSAVLAIAAHEDRTTPPSHLRTIADRIPGARYVETAGAHLVNVENPDRINELLIQHLLEETHA